MTIRVKLLALMLMAVIVSCAKNVPKDAKYTIMPDSVVYANLGKTMSDILFSPKKVTCYLIVGKKEVGSNDYELEDHYVRDAFVCKLTKEQTAILQFDLLASQRNYGSDSIKVRSPYVPSIEFCFEQKKGTVHVLISLSNYSWTIYYDDKRQGNWNYADKDLIDRFCQMVLGDLYKKAL